MDRGGSLSSPLASPFLFQLGVVFLSVGTFDRGGSDDDGDDASGAAFEFAMVRSAEQRLARNKERTPARYVQ